jgi:FtsH-binding integral membrane protein
MMKTDVHKVYIFLALVLLASLPFYALNLATVSLPFGLPPSVAMIVVPLLVAACFWLSGTHQPVER